MTYFRHAGSHAEALASSRMLAPGDAVELSRAEQRDPHNKRLIDEGILLPAKADTNNEEGGEA